MINISKSYGTRTLFEGVTLQMNKGERLGLVGRNGHGKSTLFKIILGEEQYDNGTLSFPKNYKVGHLAQHLKFTKDTILDEAILGLPEDEKDDHYKVEAILFGLGFSKTDLSKSPSEFSGGFQIRLNLAKVLVSNPNLLLLDEPTNYLDIVSIRWLESFLRKWKNELVVITHDRDFMDEVSTHTAMIHRQKLKKIQGDTAKIYEQIMLEEEIHEKTRLNDEKKRRDIEEFVTRFRAQANKASLVQSRVKQLEKMPETEKLQKIATLGFSFNYAPTMAKEIIKVENLNFSYNDSNLLIKDLGFTIKQGEKVAIIGKNGKGKSTLLNLLTKNLNPTSGEITHHSSLKQGYFGQTNINRLNPKVTIEEEIGSSNFDLSKTQVRNICGTMMFTSDDAEKKISVLSGGEKSRVMLGKILATKANVLFLDEPTNHLDMDSISALTESLLYFPGTVIIVTHSEMILKSLATKFIVFKNDEQLVFDGTYEDFLNKVGWDEEELPSITEKKSNLSKKEIQIERANIIKERAKILGPLKDEIDFLEKDITRLEQVISKNNEEILIVSDSGHTHKIAGLSLEIKNAENKIEEHFLELELKSSLFNSKTKEYEEKLNLLC